MADRRNGEERRQGDYLCRRYMWDVIDYMTSEAKETFSLAEQGAYRNLIDQLWFRGGRIRNNERLWQKAGASCPAEFEPIWEAIRIEFDTETNGEWITHRRVTQEFHVAEDIYKRKRKAGIESGKSRRNKRFSVQTEREQTDEHLPNHNSTEQNITELKSKASPTRAEFATQMPKDFEPNAAHRALATKLGVDLAGEFEAFRDHHLAKGSRFKVWDFALNTWLRKAKHFGRSNGNANHRQRGNPQCPDCAGEGIRASKLTPGRTVTCECVPSASSGTA